MNTTKRNKKRFPAQQNLTQLRALAHNTLIWARLWLANRCQRISRFGLKRWVRDVLHLNEVVVFDHHLNLLQLILNPADPLAKELAIGLAALLAGVQVAFTSGEI